ncbi:MAG: DUF3604 domain-containing protein [Deltaproteobacteria bacterium]|nr:DUF3604 domain-containing protein [Deltaproteobacteria bacterium]
MSDKWIALSVSVALAACESTTPSVTDAGAADVAGGDVSRVLVRPDTHVACRRRNPLREPFFGDLHVHTGLSFDAASWGTRARPSDAYRFARGESVGLAPYDAEGRATRTARLTRPLDFTAVTDHSEFLAETDLCTTAGSALYDTRTCREQRETRLVAATDYALPLSSRMPARPAICRNENAELCAARLRTVWEETQQAAEEAYDRSDECRFTSFVGYEWTGSPGANNLHRNIIFRNASVPRSPTSYIEAPTPDQLWRALDRDCLATGTPCDALAIPHNSNQSAGLMFALTTEDGRPYDAAFAARRARLEPLVEIYQHKGSSECIPGAASLLASEDEACRFEQLTGVPCVAPGNPVGCTPLCSVAGGFGLAGACIEPADFVRPALRRGLAEYLRIGADPFHLGFIASTDTHNATPGLVEEDSWPGHAARGDDTAEGRLTPEGMGRPITIRLNSPGGLAVLWAEENTRDSLFGAMRRREAYATSGTRVVVRFFGGWSLPEGLCDARDLAEQGYALGVPMGSDLPARPGGSGAPAFVVSALRDAMGSPLQRIEIVKGWADASGTHERVYRVDGEASGATVDPATCAARGTPGAATRCGVWRDPDFDPAAAAFWYARVLEDPTCRWSRRLCNELRVDCARVPRGSPLVACCDGSLPDTVQERAWTSPIWYLPPR